ncbi:hypothetical protein F183_A25910 [Bryobacterales bacterium F-183]|nr:hypothetical protein F183_A25910 [Bryobacterales bacterium F-183]
MALQLTAEQEQRIAAVVDSGAYGSAEDALNAALAAVETAALPSFDGPEHELEALLLQGLDSKELSEDEFWSSVRREADKIVASAPRR